MKRFSDIFDSINIDMIKEAVVRASDRHGWKTEVIRFNENLDVNCNMITIICWMMVIFLLSNTRNLRRSMGMGR